MQARGQPSIRNGGRLVSFGNESQRLVKGEVLPHTGQSSRLVSGANNRKRKTLDSAEHGRLIKTSAANRIARSLSTAGGASF